MVEKDIRNFVKRRDRCCQKCGVAENLTIDHVIPLARGGTDSPDNLQAMCRECNSDKMYFIDWTLFRRIRIALHLDEIVSKLRVEGRAERKSLLKVLRQEFDSLAQTKVDGLRQDTGAALDDLWKEGRGQRQTIDFLTKKIAALEARQKIHWESKVIPEQTIEGYVPIRAVR